MLSEPNRTQQSDRPRARELLRSGCILSGASPGSGYWLGWGEVAKQSEPSDRDLSLYAPDFFLKDPTPWRVFQNSCRLTHGELLSLLEQSDPVAESSTIVWKAAKFDEFRGAFLDLKKQFKRGKLKKAVPIVMEEGFFEGDAADQRGRLLLHLLRSTQGFPLFVYGVWNEQEGILGATPEILFQQNNPGVLQTVALAGTRPRSTLSEIPHPDLLLPGPSGPGLLEDPKEMEEHRIVIEGVRGSLEGLRGKELGPGTVTVGTTRELKLPTLVHLMTPITLTSEAGLSPRFETSVHCLHPTPALGAFPKEAGQAWLESYTLNRRRKRFGAPLGAVWGSGESLCVVAIRNLQWEGSNYQICAGCGVVSASQLEKECEELRAKIGSVKKMFGFYENQS